MSYAAKALRGTARRLLTVQALLVMLAAGFYLALQGWQPASAALFGGAIALFNTLVSAHRLARASAVQDPKFGMMELYIGAVIRFIGTPALIAVGILVLSLDPVAILVGFVAAQAGYFFGNARPHSPTKNS